jgi:hypothetical protein
MRGAKAATYPIFTHAALYDWEKKWNRARANVLRPFVSPRNSATPVCNRLVRSLGPKGNNNFGVNVLRAIPLLIKFKLSP